MKKKMKMNDEKEEENLAAGGVIRREADITARHNNEIKCHEQPRMK